MNDWIDEEIVKIFRKMNIYLSSKSLSRHIEKYSGIRISPHTIAFHLSHLPIDLIDLRVPKYRVQLDRIIFMHLRLSEIRESCGEAEAIPE